MFLLCILLTSSNINKSFLKKWVDYYREVFSCVYSRTSPVFLFLFPIFLSHFYILWNLVYPSGFDSSSWFFPSIFLCRMFLDIISSLIRITCSNNLNQLLSMSFFHELKGSILCLYFLSCPCLFSLKFLLKLSFPWLQFCYPLFLKFSSFRLQNKINK